MSNGLGDSIASVTNFLGINKVADAVAKLVGAPDCGCKERQEYLNYLFPYDSYSRTFNVTKNFIYNEIVYQQGSTINVTQESPLFPAVIHFVKEGMLEEI
jgi:hypothetical protein